MIKTPTRKASFKGFGFYCDIPEESGGFRIVEHEYPNRDEHYIEELGHAPNRYAVEGYITEPDLQEKKEALKSALMDHGAGPLYDPFEGVYLEVYVVEWSISGSDRKLGRYDFSASFVEKGDTPAPYTSYSAKAQLANFLDKYIDAIALVFNTAYKVIKAIRNVKEWLNYAAAKIEAAADLISAAKSKVSVSDSGDFWRSVNDLKSNSESIAYDGKEHDEVVKTMEVLSDSLSDNQASIVFKELVRIDLGRMGGNSALADDLDNNTQALERSIRYAALIHWGSAVVNTDYADRVSAHNDRIEFVSAAYDLQLDASGAGYHDMYQKIDNLVSIVGRRYGDLSDDLKPVATKQSKMPHTALSAAWDLYQDPTKASDLMARNGGGNGSFLPLNLEYVNG